jgi:non-ribosomal peptide synthase protein (TIGR01720 family)
MAHQSSRRTEGLSAQEKRALLAQIYAAQAQKPKSAPLSLAQERVLALCQLEPASPGYNITTAYSLRGPLDVPRLEQALNQIVRRQAVLRTNFDSVDGRMVQLVAHSRLLPLELHDLDGIPPAAREVRVRRMVLRQAQQPFDLAHDLLLRVSLIRVAADEHLLALTTHRLVFDGQCWPVLINELVALCVDGHAPLPELPLQYADFAAWQREWLAGDALEGQLGYWRGQLSGRLRLLRLPADHPRAAGQIRSTLHTFTLPEQISEALRGLSQREGISLFVTLLAAFQLLLYRATGQEDLVVFTSVAGRSRPEIKGLLGLFANLLALRGDLSGDPSFRELLGRARETAAAAYAHQDVPFEQILEHMQVERDQPYASIFQAMLIFWPEPLPPLEWPGLTISPFDIDTRPADFDLLLHITNTRPAISGMLRYKADLFEAGTIARLVERFVGLLADVTAGPQRPISELGGSRVTAEQEAVAGLAPIMPSQWSYLRTPHLWVNMVEVVELRRRPDAALLEQAVGQIVEHHDALRTRFAYDGQWQQWIDPPGGAAPFSYVDLSAQQIEDPLAALKDALAAQQSRFGPLKDTLVQVTLFDLGPRWPSYLVFTVHHVIADNASLPLLLEDLHAAYRQLEQGAAVRLPARTASVKQWAELLSGYLRSETFARQLERELALFQRPCAPLPVDDEAGRAHNTLSSLAQVQVLLDAEQTGVLLKDLPRTHKVWLLDILLAALVQALTRWSGGSAVMLQMVDAGRNLELPGLEDVDLSRTTGCLFVPSVVQLERPAADDPLEALQQVHAQFQRFLTFGIAVGIAQQLADYPAARSLPPAELRLNYLGQPSLAQLPDWVPDTSTALEDFVANRRHGDIDRNPLLLNCTAVVLAGQLVVAWEYSKSVHRQATIERVADDFVAALRALVRHYRQQVPAGPHAPEQNRVYVAPRTAAEELLAGVWAEVLGYERVGVHDNFFELGGDSLTGLRIIARSNQLGLHLTPKRLFEHQTVAALTEVEAAHQAADEQVTGAVLLTPAQHWLLAQSPASPPQEHQSLVLELKQRADPGLLEAALQSLQEHHDGLRLRLEHSVDGWRQSVAGAATTALLAHYDLSALPEREQDSALVEAEAQLHLSLSPTAGPLLRAALFDLGPRRHGRLLILLHRFVADPRSWQILLEDLDSAYRQLGQGQPIRLPVKTTSLKRWAEQLAERARAAEAVQERSFWLEQSRRAAPSLPVDLAGGENTACSAECVLVALDSAATQALLHEIHQAYHTRTDEVLLAALSQALAPWVGSRVLLLDLESSAREEQAEKPGTARTIGWLTPVFPVLLDLSAVSAPGETLMSVKEQLRQAPGQGYSYGILRYLGEDVEIAAAPQPQVRFSYLGEADQEIAASALLGPAQALAAHYSPAAARRHLLEISASVTAGRLQLAWTYSRALHRRSTIEGLAAAFDEALRALIGHCQSPEAGAYTPSDFAEFDWGTDYLQDIAAAIEKVTG